MFTLLLKQQFNWKRKKAIIYAIIQKKKVFSLTYLKLRLLVLPWLRSEPVPGELQNLKSQAQQNCVLVPDGTHE